MGRLLVLFCLLALAAAEDYADNESVKLFQEYVRINTTTNNNLTKAVEFWKNLAKKQGVEFKKYEYVAGYPVVVLKWPGSDPSLGSIMLNSHMDVVPALEDGWIHPPFSGTLDAEGVIWGRGTQDMKSVGIQYFEALKSLKAEKKTLLRNVYMTFMPDEETGGIFGMVKFLNSTEFKNMNVGVELDEGASYNKTSTSPVFYQDKEPWQIQVNCYGEAAHGSFFPETNTTATGKCRNVINIMLAFRDEEHKKAPKPNRGVTLIADAWKYTSVNLNKINAGTANNIIPGNESLVFDIRLGTRINATKFDAKLRNMIAQAGDNITMTYLLKGPQTPATRLENNPYWTAISTAATSVGLTLLPMVPSGATDGRYVRGIGIPAFGFSPMPSTILLGHVVNERLAASTFVEGIKVYKEIITNLANIPGSDTSSVPFTYLYATESADQVSL